MRFILRHDDKGKGKGRLWVLQHCCLEAYCTLTQNEFLHSSPEALHTPSGVRHLC